MRIRLISILCILLYSGSSASAQQNNDFAAVLNMLNQPVSGNMIHMIMLLTILSIAPGILVMITSFTRIVIVFSFLRSSLGLQTVPGNMVLVSLALFMTYFVMAPTFEVAWNTGVKPLLNKEIDQNVAMQKAIEPFREFMLKQVRDKDLAMLSAIAPTSPGSDPGNVETRVLIPAFMISELRRAFEIGFLIALPFLIIDIIVATIVMAMGMMMMPPSVISLPIKILFFVLIDGWNLIVGSMIKSFS